MILRADRVVAGGWWCFPGGAVQDGESEVSALKREMIEELDVEVEVGEVIWRWSREDGMLRVTFRWATLVGGVPRANPDEVQEARWMTAAEVRSLDRVLANNLETLNHLGNSVVPL
jgi:8-oxo-dGTP pyrophosphatase MutT (NUDIX family)